LNYHFQIVDEENGYSAFCLELKGCRTQGDSMEDLIHNLSEALELYLDEPIGSNVLFPGPDYSLIINKNIIAVSVDPRTAFALLIRRYRIENRMTQSEAQSMIGMVNKTSYNRLEKRSNPRLETIARIIRAFPDFPLAECFPKIM
jgi:predicted RNase H-like HicB family nuclease